jgi:hypothetical protein
MRVLASTLLALFIVLGCGVTVVAPSAMPAPEVNPSAVPTPSASATEASPVPGGLPELAECSHGEHCEVPAGSYVTGMGGFFPGLEITLPGGWAFGEQDAGEIVLRPSVDQYPVLSIAKNVRVVTTTRAMGPETEIVEDVAATPEAFVEWFVDSSDFTMIEQPTAASIAGVTGTMFTLQVSETAAFGDPGCPWNPRCGDIFTDPAHWGPNVFSIGGEEAARMFVASIPYPGVDHLLAISWITPSAADLPAFIDETQSIVDSIKLPKQYVQN